MRYLGCTFENGLAEKREGGRERQGNSEYHGKGKKWKEHIFKPMLIYLSSQTKQVHKGKKCSSLLRTLLKCLTLNSEIRDNKQHDAHWLRNNDYWAWVRYTSGSVSSEVILGYHPAEYTVSLIQSSFCPVEGTCSGAGETTWIAQDTKGPQATRCKQEGVGEGEQEQLVAQGLPLMQN